MKSLILIAAVLGGLMLIAGVYGVSTWEAVGPTDMGFHGWFALLLMVVLTLAIGVGLMGLVFYSSRKGYDDQPNISKDD